MEAYDRYMQDEQQAGDQQWQQLFTQVEQLRGAVELLVKNGQFH